MVKADSSQASRLGFWLPALVSGSGTVLLLVSHLGETLPQDQHSTCNPLRFAGLIPTST